MINKKYITKINKYTCDNFASIGTKLPEIKPKMIPKYLFEKMFYIQYRAKKLK